MDKYNCKECRGKVRHQMNNIRAVLVGYLSMAEDDPGSADKYFQKLRKVDYMIGSLINKMLR